MIYRKARFRGLGALVGIGITCAGLVVVSAATAQAAAFCPTVAADGTVSPTPTSYENWRGCDLQNANLAGVNLTGSALSGSDLAGADLAGATLTNVQLADVSISGANLLGATLTGVSSGAVTAADVATLPANWTLLGGYLIGPGADLSNAALSGLDLSGVDLQGATLTGASIEGTVLTQANLADAVTGSLTGTPLLSPDWLLINGYLAGPDAWLLGADLSGQGSALSGANLSGANLLVANLTGDDLAGANLSGADLSSAHMPGASLAHAVLSRANLSYAELSSVDLAGSSLSGANLLGAVLTGANLSGASVSGATFETSTLTSANLSSVNLSDADLTSVRSGGIIGAPLLPPKWSLIHGYLVGPSANLRNASLPGVQLAGRDLTDTMFSQANLSGANLSGASLQYAQFNAADLRGADLAGADLQATLEQANLTDANLSKANLRNADVSQIVMSGTNFAGANLDGIVMYGPTTLKGTPAALPGHFVARAGYLFGPGASVLYPTLKNANLGGIDLAGGSLRSATMSSVNLSRANLTGVDLSYGYLSSVNLSDANLTDANLSRSISSVYLAGANLTGANLYPDSSLVAADTPGAIWRHTKCPDGTNSDQHVKGCFSARDTTPPTAAVTGVANGKVYVTGGVPRAGCRTTDNGTVAIGASVTVTTTGKNGVGRFTATCAGAVDLAGNKQKAPVSVTYRVVYGLHGFLAPASGSTIARSSKTITVRLRLTSATGRTIPASAAKALAAASDVQATLRGPGIPVVGTTCSWNATQQDITCAIRIPSGVRTGSAQRYTITADENVGTGFLAVPAVGATADPEVVHFR